MLVVEVHREDETDTTSQPQSSFTSCLMNERPTLLEAVDPTCAGVALELDKAPGFGVMMWISSVRQESLP